MLVPRTNPLKGIVDACFVLRAASDTCLYDAWLLNRRIGDERMVRCLMTAMVGHGRVSYGTPSYTNLYTVSSIDRHDKFCIIAYALDAS